MCKRLIEGLILGMAKWTQNRMNYKVCILAAGVGSKMGEFSKYIHHSLLPVNFKATLSYIIDKFPKSIEIVIAVGHKKDTIKDYLSIMYQDRDFTFVDVDKFIGQGIGPGYSLLQCKNHLNCPFIFFTSDTIVLEEIPEPAENWMGIAPIKETENYCTVKIKNNLIYELADKIKTDNKHAFVGIAGIRDYDLFWTALEKGKDSSPGEIRDINGFKSLIEKKLVPISFTWFDTGSKENYFETNKNFSGENKSFDFSKNNEFLYFVDGRVTKFFAEEELARKRYERSKLLEGFCPKVDAYKNNFYSYKKVDGNVLYQIINKVTIKDLLHWADQIFWKRRELNSTEKEDFYNSCKSFYYDKTLGRIEDFYRNNNLSDSENIINGVYTPSLKELLSRVDWNNLFAGIPSRFHGDFTVGNILVKVDPKTNLNKFVLLDWRHDFANSLEVGDMYYDLAKLYKGILLSDDLVKEGKFSFDMSGSSVYYDYFLTRNLVEAKEAYEQFILEKGLDLKKIRILSAICLLNMSSLHKYPFNFLVYYLGKNMLNSIVNGGENGGI